MGCLCGHNESCAICAPSAQELRDEEFIKGVEAGTLHISQWPKDALEKLQAHLTAELEARKRMQPVEVTGTQESYRDGWEFKEGDGLEKTFEKFRGRRVRIRIEPLEE